MTNTNRALLNNTRSPSPHRGPVTGATTPGTQNSGVAQQVRKRPVKHPGGYFDSPEDGAGDAASHATSDAHFPGAGALPHPDQPRSPLDGFSTRTPTSATHHQGQQRAANAPGAFLSPSGAAAAPHRRLPACPDSTQAISSHPVHQQRHQQATDPSKSPGRQHYKPTWVNAAAGKRTDHRQQPSKGHPRDTPFQISVPGKEPGTCESTSAAHRQAGQLPELSPRLSPSNKGRHAFTPPPRSKTPQLDTSTLGLQRSPLDATPTAFNARLAAEPSGISTTHTDTFSVDEADPLKSTRHMFNSTPRGFNDNTRTSDDIQSPPGALARLAYGEGGARGGQRTRRPSTPPTDTNRVFSVKNPQLTPGLLDVEQSVTTPPLPARPRPSPESDVGAVGVSAASGKKTPHVVGRNVPSGQGVTTPPAVDGGGGVKSATSIGKSGGRSASPSLGLGTVFGANRKGGSSFFLNSSPVDKSIHIQPVLAPAPEGSRAQGNVDPRQSVHIQPVLAVSSRKMTPRLGSAGGQSQGQGGQRSPLKGASSDRRDSMGTAGGAGNVATGATAPARRVSAESGGGGGAPAARTPRGGEVATGAAGPSRRGSIESGAGTPTTATPRSARGQRGSLQGSSSKPVVATGGQPAAANVNVSASTDAAARAASEAMEAAAAALAGTVATGAAGTRTPTPRSARSVETGKGPMSGGPRSGGPRSTPRLNAATQPPSVPEDTPALPMPEGSPAKLRPKPKGAGKAPSAQQEQPGVRESVWTRWWSGGANPGAEGGSGAAADKKDPPGATPMFGSLASTTAGSTAATKADAQRPLGLRLLAAFGGPAAASPHDTPQATSTIHQAPATKKRGPTLTSIALASIALDGGPPSPPRGPASTAKSPRVPPPAPTRSPRLAGAADGDLPASKSNLSVPEHLAQHAPDSPQRVAQEILAAQGAAREENSARSGAITTSAQPSVEKIDDQRSIASDLFLSADASMLRLPLPPAGSGAPNAGGSSSRRCSTGQANPPSNPPSHRRSHSAEEFAAAAHSGVLHPLSQTRTTLGQGAGSVNTTPRQFNANTPRTDANLRHGPKSARPAGPSARPMHADDPSPDPGLTRMQSAAAALRVGKSGMSRGGTTTLHNEPSAASTGVMHTRPRHKFSNAGATPRTPQHAPSPRSPHDAALGSFCATDASGGPLPGREVSGYSDLSGLRGEHSNASRYVGYVAGALGDAVLEVDGESDMHDMHDTIAAGGKSSHLLLGTRTEGGGGGEEEDKEGMEPVLQELNDTSPFFLVSLVARFPVMAMFLLFCFFLACAAPAALPAYRPRSNNDFTSLLVRDHPSAAMEFADESFSQFYSFWHLEKDPSDRGDPTATSDGDGDESRRMSARRRSARRLAEFNSILDDISHSSGSQHSSKHSPSRSIQKVLSESMHVSAIDRSSEVTGGGRELQDSQGKVGGDGLRTEITTMLNIFYRYADNATAIAEEMVERSRALEQKIMDHGVWTNICRQQEDGRCHPPSSFATVLYATEIESGESEPIYQLADTPQRDMHETAAELVANNFTLFFDLNTDGVHADYLHTIVMFSEPRGNSDYYDSMLPDLLKLFEKEQTDDVIVNFGEDAIIARQVDVQLLQDAMWSGLSLLCAAVMLRLGAGSTFLTIAGVFQLMVSFPISWIAYAVPRGWAYINFLHFLAPFVVLGIGLDDIFVFVSFFEDTRPYARHFALDTRLSRTFSRASGACLATSTTSAFAFAANVFSPVPAVQSFGLLLATLVIVNYILSILWLPVCLAAWDKHIMFPALARADEAANFGNQQRKKSPLAALCCCLETVSTDIYTMSIRPGGFVLRAPPRVLEYGRVAWPFLRVPENHRLAAPRGRRVLLRVPEPEFRQQSWMEAKTNTAFRAAFDGVYKFRWLTVLLVVGASVAGGIGAMNLSEPPTSEPPLFHEDHNVQFFWRYQNSEQADNIPVCNACSKPLAEMLTDPVGLTQTLLGTPAGDDGHLSTASGVFSTVPATIIWGLAPGGIDNSPNVEGDPVGIPQIDPLTFDTEFDLSQPQWQLLVQRQMADLFEDSTVGTGVEAVDNATESAGVGDVVTSTSVQATNHRRDLVGELQSNPLTVLREFCDGVFGADDAALNGSKPFCSNPHNESGLPTGDDFNHAVFRMVAAGDGMEYRKLIGYEWPGETAEVYMARSNDGEREGPWPQVKWLKVEVLTATVKSSAPREVEHSYNEWLKWIDFIQEEETYKGVFVASPDWVTAVTHTEISSSIRATVLLSVALAAVVVFVFAGRPVLTLIATLTVIMTNVSVMGLMYVWGWTLGAIEGMSITSLVGLSVDFCIHLCEGHMHAKAPERFGKAREAFTLVGIPMAASGLSTVATCLPLFATETVILNRFAAVLSITMGIGLAYVLLFLAPMMAMVGPVVTKTRAPVTASVLSRSLTVLLNSKAVRFMVVCMLALLTLAIAPAANNYMNFTGPLADLGKLLFALIGIALATVLVRAGIKVAAQHRAAREALNEMAGEEEASRRNPPGLSDCNSSKVAAYHPGLSAFKSELTTNFGMMTV